MTAEMSTWSKQSIKYLLGGTEEKKEKVGVSDPKLQQRHN